MIQRLDCLDRRQAFSGTWSCSQGSVNRDRCRRLAASERLPLEVKISRLFNTRHTSAGGYLVEPGFAYGDTCVQTRS